MNDDEAIRATTRRVLRITGTLAGWLLLAALVLYGCWAVRAVWPPFFVAFVMAVALAPVVDRLEAKRWPRWLAAATVYLLLFGAIAAMLFVLVPEVSNQVLQIVADLRGRFRLDQPADLNRNMAEQIRLFGRKNEIPSWMIAPALQQAKNSASLVAVALDRFARLLVGLIPNLIWVVLVPVVAFYALVDYHRIFAKALLLFPREKRDEVRTIASDVAVVFGKYLRGLGIVCLLNTFATIVVLTLFPATRPYAAALGLIAGLLYAVPYLGAIVSTALISLVALTSPDGGSLQTMLIVTASMLLLHQILFDQVIAPRVLGGHVGLHPILSILALMSGEALFGIAGMLVAVPVAASIQIIILHGMPRLGRKIEVKPQETSPTGPVPTDPAADQPTLIVPTGEGVTGAPATTRRS